MDAPAFFNEVTRPNITAAVSDNDDYRLTVNAVLSVDAAYGILFQQLKDMKHPFLEPIPIKKIKRGMQDGDFKDHVAGMSREFAAIRDAAYATKHGRLDSASRIVKSASDVKTRKLTCGLFAAGDPLGGSAVFITLDGKKLQRSWWLLRKVEMFTDELFGDLELAPRVCPLPEYHEAAILANAAS